MEMHQVRYFLAAVEELNFTKAAEKCNVSQPSLTRAIKQLEGELGGDLFRRERPQAQLTELGQRMLPLLKQCYDSALGARSLASELRKGQVGSLRLALSRSVSLDLLVSYLGELRKAFQGLELKLLRGTAAEIVELLKKGEAELAVAGEIPEDWERLDKWPLFTERFQLIVNRDHELASRASLEALRGQRFLRRTYCEELDRLCELLRSHDVAMDQGDDVTSERDVIALIEGNLGMAFMPRSTPTPQTLTSTAIGGIDLNRTVYVYGVAGRQRTPVASTILKMLRASDWSRFTN